MAEMDDVKVKIVDGKGDYATTPNDDTESSSKKISSKKKKKEDAVNPVGVFELFRFADCLDILLMLIASTAAIAMGLSIPGLMIMFGGSVDAFSSNTYRKPQIIQLFEAENKTVPSGLNVTQLTELAGVNNISLDKLKNEFFPMMRKQAIFYCIFAVMVICCGYIAVTLFVTAATRQTHRIRNKCFAAIVRQNIGWFDTQKSGDLNIRLTNDIMKISEGMGDKFGHIFTSFATALAGLLYGFITGWKLTLVILAISPVIMAGGYFMTKLASSFTQKEMKSYGKAGGIASEVLGSIRTVAAFGGEEKEVERYTANLFEARNFGIKKGLSAGISAGFYWFVLFSISAVGFWYGAKLSRDEPENYSPGKVLSVFICVAVGAMSLGQATPGIQANGEARGAARTIYDLIDRVSPINYENDDGDELQKVEGEISFHDVKFSYPTRKEITAFDVKSMTIPAGKTVALVGSSGCGKSTTVGLIQRFYDPDSGSVKLDGVDIKTLRLEWYRSLIGIVSQEPVLFACTIRENIRYGHESVSDSEIEECAKQANAHDFISELPDGYDTLVGERGAQLSGGQKQRIAIARSLVRNPKILLLDEATSALDTESESLVQSALERAGKGRTTIVIAHRLSTVRNADLIIGLENGQMKEIGTHDELMEKGGIYANLVARQTREEDKDLKVTPGKEEVTPGKEDEENEIEIALARKRFTSKSSADNEQVKYSHGKIRHRGISTTNEEDAEPLVGEGDEKAVEEEIKNTEAGFLSLLKLNAKEWHWILFGCICALINGALQPCSGIVTASFLTIMGETDLKVQEERTNFWTLIYIGMAVLVFLCQMLQSYMFSRSGEELTLRCRSLMFSAFMRQEISFFDWPSNNLGALTAHLSTDASLIQNGTGVKLGMMMCALSGLGLGGFIAFFYCWQLALVIIAFVPLIALGGFMEMAVMKGHALKDREASEAAAKVSVEATENIRTVVGLQLEKKFVEKYRKKLLVTHIPALRNAHLHGFAYGLSQGVLYFSMGTAFYYGAFLISKDVTTFHKIMRVFMSLLYGASAIGNASALAPDAGKAAAASQYLFWLLGRKTSIDSSSNEGTEMKAPEGRVSLRGVRFRYPTRLEVPVLRGVDIDIEPGERVAIVGSSGCGKSTIMQLLERFYDPLDGEICIDGVPIQDLRISSLRYILSMVSQEPVLFDRTIAENIAYGNNANPPSMQEIIEAAKKSNIHSFIESIPEGYETKVGEKGTQLSGGQKQRIAIARAMVRDPKILLLDEATSALDTESEKVVQEALDNVQEGRTCIVIAHRLSTIRDADRIIVIHHGRIEEVGKHADLMLKQGIYYRLVNSQATAGLS